MSRLLPREVEATAILVVGLILLLPGFPLRGTPSGAGPGSERPYPGSVAAVEPSSGAVPPLVGSAPRPSGAPPPPVNNYSAPVWWPAASSGPQWSGGPAITYDAGDGYLLMFGGLTSTGNLNETWKFSAGHWTQLHPRGAPTARNGASMAYDALDQYVVLFGGYNASSTSWYSDTWTFARGVWSPLFPSSSPPAAGSSGIAYDAADHYVVLVGGSPAYQSTTWTFAGGQWTKLAITGTQPSGRGYDRMTYDASRGAVILFGGTASGGGAPMNDTWVLSGTYWTQLTGPSTLMARMSPGLTYDPLLGGDVLYGGWRQWGASPASDTWLLAANGWVNLSLNPNPGGQDAPAMQFDPTDQSVLTFGGNGNGGLMSNVTWKLSQLNVSAAEASPSAVDLSRSTNLSANVSGGSGSYSTSWVGVPAGCPATAGRVNDCAPTEVGNFSPQLIVHDSVLHVTVDSAAGHLTIAPFVSVRIVANATTLRPGQYVNLSARVSGGLAPFSYVWLVNGTPLAGSNSSWVTYPPLGVVRHGPATVQVSVTDGGLGSNQSGPWNLTFLPNASRPGGGSTGGSGTLPPFPWVYLAAGVIVVAAAVAAAALLRRRRSPSVVDPSPPQ